MPSRPSLTEELVQHHAYRLPNGTIVVADRDGGDAWRLATLAEWAAVSRGAYRVEPDGRITHREQPTRWRRSELVALPGRVADPSAALL